MVFVPLLLTLFARPAITTVTTSLSNVIFPTAVSCAAVERISSSASRGRSALAELLVCGMQSRN